MTAALTSRQLERMRRTAKRLARDEGIPLHEAQQQLASRRGFKNWALMVRGSTPSEQTKPSRQGPWPKIGMLQGHTTLLMTLSYSRPDARHRLALLRGLKAQ